MVHTLPQSPPCGGASPLWEGAEGCGGAALPSPGEKVAERSEVGCGMRAITLRKQSGIILADGKFSAGLCDVEDPTFFPAFHLSQLR